MWNGARDIIKEKAGPIKEVSVNCDLLNSALNYYQIVRKLCPKSLIFFTIPKIMVSYVSIFLVVIEQHFPSGLELCFSLQNVL